jgi:hypothetical protein
LSIMKSILDSSTVPNFVKTKVHRLLSSLESPKTKPLWDWSLQGFYSVK